MAQYPFIVWRSVSVLGVAMTCATFQVAGHTRGREMQCVMPGDMVRGFLALVKGNEGHMVVS